ncbi:hypothetical protein Aph01nite_21240 [Acrocarpospora phusangensis]|uniref:Radical SAM core domain-containing protein n=2 Tax=Acrocarpospora phusangensis TaxID=1070424 RepID=A0A919Q9S5_9ACTN|nr:hypothetical protein Aph01nite_21240 [Acrocarpospora phusangensis]
MSVETAALAAERIAEHVEEHDVKNIHVVLHGGEPLLAGHDLLADIIRVLRERLDGICHLDLRIHTNGVTLDSRFCDLFAKNQIKVGISLDGDRIANDRHRLYANGRSSYDQVIKAIALLRARPEIYAGLLCTIDVANDPIAVYEALVALQPPRVDFLLPHATWDEPPPRPSATAYADWLITIFDRWQADGRPVPVRLFESVINTVQGRGSLSEAIGLEPTTLVVIETDGGYEQVDSLKVAFDGAPATGFDLAGHSLNEVAGHPGVRARQRGLDGLSATCRACPVVRSCGGGLYPHRFRDGSFDNPSVFCADLLALISHIRDNTAMINPANNHGMPAATYDALASGFGDGGDIETLARSQSSLQRMIVASLPDRPPAAWDLLVALDRDHRATLLTVLAHPYVRVWAATRAHAGPGYLANIAAAAAYRAGLSVRVPVAVTGGSVHLPTVGTFDEVPGDTATLVVEAGSAWIDGPATALIGTRRLRSGDFSVLLEDRDPNRDCHQWPAAATLGKADADAWQECFDPAWRLIESDYPAYAEGLRAGLSTIMPLAPAPAGKDVSSTARHAFGAVAAALPADPATLALLLIHEFQHVKLGALLDLFDLYDESDTTLYHAPWRQDPRPLEGLLQGTYAHIAVSDFWRVRRDRVTGPEQVRAREQYTLWRGHTEGAIETLSASGRLTVFGDRAVARMRRTVQGWES